MINPAMLSAIASILGVGMQGAQMAKGQPPPQNPTSSLDVKLGNKPPMQMPRFYNTNPMQNMNRRPYSLSSTLGRYGGLM